MTSTATVDSLLALFDEAFIDELYRVLLGREPDPIGRLGHIEQLRRGYPKVAFIAHFARSAEGVAHAARIDGLAELCTLADAADGGAVSRWVAARARAAGLASTADIAMLENRLGRQLQALHDKLDPVLARVEAAAAAPPAVSTLPASADANTAELYRRMVQLGQAVARLDERLERFEHQFGRNERQSAATENRRRTELEAAVAGLRAALDRVESRLADGPRGTGTEA